MENKREIVRRLKDNKSDERERKNRNNLKLVKSQIQEVNQVIEEMLEERLIKSCGIVFKH